MRPARQFVLALDTAWRRSAFRFRGADLAGLLAGKEAAGAHGGVVSAPLVGLEHLDDEGDDGLRPEILAALFPLREGELAEEVFVNVAEDVLGVQVGVLEGDGGDEVDEAAEVRRVELELGVGRRSASGSPARWRRARRR